jgi:hypothetical protein
MHLEMTIRIGDILQIGATVAVVLGAYVKLREQMVTLQTQIAPLWKEFTDRRVYTRREEDRG